MPRRCPALSRPFRLLPCPFLCAIARRSRCAFDARHAHDRQLLAMATATAVVLATLLLEDEDFFRLLLTDDLAHDPHARDQRLPDLDGTSGGREQHLVEGAGRSGITVELLEANRVAGADPVLLAAGANDRVIHGGIPL